MKVRLASSEFGGLTAAMRAVLDRVSPGMTKRCMRQFLCHRKPIEVDDADAARRAFAAIGVDILFGESYAEREGLDGLAAREAMYAPSMVGVRVATAGQLRSIKKAEAAGALSVPEAAALRATVRQMHKLRQAWKGFENWHGCSCESLNDGLAMRALRSVVAVER